MILRDRFLIIPYFHCYLHLHLLPHLLENPVAIKLGITVYPLEWLKLKKPKNKKLTTPSDGEDVEKLEPPSC